MACNFVAEVFAILGTAHEVKPPIKRHELAVNDLPMAAPEQLLQSLRCLAAKIADLKKHKILCLTLHG